VERRVEVGALRDAYRAQIMSNAASGYAGYINAVFEAADGRGAADAAYRAYEG
jgi:hypothetical protein